MYTSRLPCRAEVNRIFGVVGASAKSRPTAPHISIKRMIQTINSTLIPVSPMVIFQICDMRDIPCQIPLHLLYIFLVKPTITWTLCGEVTNLASGDGWGCHPPKCSHIFGLYYKSNSRLISLVNLFHKSFQFKRVFDTF